jgi:hypothetical protein
VVERTDRVDRVDRGGRGGRGGRHDWYISTGIVGPTPVRSTPPPVPLRDLAFWLDWLGWLVWPLWQCRVYAPRVGMRGDRLVTERKTVKAVSA